MLAASEIPTDEHLQDCLSRGPLLLTPKYDGIRALTGDGQVVSRRLKPIPNRYVRETIANAVGDLRLDGEAVCLSIDGMLDFNSTQSAIMSFDGRPAFRYFVFDCWDVADDYQGRIGWLYHNVQLNGPCHEVVMPEWAFTLEDVRRINEGHLAKGYEGSCARPTRSPYKNGRSTLKQSYLLKLKPFVDEEAVVIGYTPLLRNHNDPTINALGLQERSKRIDGMVEDPCCFGALICWSKKWGEINVGSGFTELQRCNPDHYLHKVITFKYQPNHSKDKPHAATFRGVRHTDDMPIEVDQ